MRICDSCVAKYICRTPGNESRADSILWWALGNLFLMLDYHAQPEYGEGAWSYGSLTCHDLLTPLGGLLFSEQILRKGGLNRRRGGRGA